VAPALEHGGEIAGSLRRLAVDLAGMISAGAPTLLVQKAVWGLVRRWGDVRRPEVVLRSLQDPTKGCPA
jgi:hypothetical protein